MSALCVGDCRPADHGGPRQAEHGRHLCSVCVDRMWENLHGIAKVWSDLEARLGTEQSGAMTTRVMSSPDRGLVINEAVSTTIREVRAWLEFVARMVIDERNLSAGPKDQTAPGLAKWLARHVDWLGKHPDESMASSLSIEAAQHHRDVKRRAYPSGVRRMDFEQIHCTEHSTSDLGERVPCEGTMYAMILPWTSGCPDLTCTVDQTHQVEPATWMRPGWKRHLDPAAAARFLGKITA